MTTPEQDGVLARLSYENAGTKLTVKEGLEDGAISVTLTVIVDRFGGRCPTTDRCE